MQHMCNSALLYIFSFLFTFMSTPPNENPSAMCWFEKDTNCKVLDPKTHQLQGEKIAVGGFLGKALRSWRIIRKSTSQLVDFY